jgi:hypothetical protein
VPASPAMMTKRSVTIPKSAVTRAVANTDSAAYLRHAISMALNGIWFSIRQCMSACLLAC